MNFEKIKELDEGFTQLSEKMLKVLECPVCFATYNTTDTLPRLLFCGHSLCLMDFDRIKNNFQVRCPSCNKVFEYPQGPIIPYKLIELLKFTKIQQKSLQDKAKLIKEQKELDINKIIRDCKTLGEQSTENARRFEKFEKEVKKLTKKAKQFQMKVQPLMKQGIDLLNKQSEKTMQIDFATAMNEESMTQIQIEGSQILLPTHKLLKEAQQKLQKHDFNKTLKQLLIKEGIIPAEDPEVLNNS